ncbi:nonribosomal peptide synthase [Penicillium soppii]|uniref:nonribosomal peptide synthase n=1 Tax=Penicillium soppii TaxID=69789 RepID=UPI002548B890|nr:nonribosomal peptide synthase [Penicillium soppii]KAJ5871120.1 nonribosomal peptide synthase [Penicillium soppii]
MANEPTSVCMFPDLGHGHSHAREEVVAIDMPKIPIREVTRWCTDSGLDPIYLFSLGWGVILRHFADVDNVLIGVSTAGTTSTARTLSTSLSGRTVESLLVSEGWTVANKQSLAVGGYNTGIKLDDLASGNDTSVVRMEYRTSFLSQPHAESVVEAFTQAIWSILKDPKQKVVEINVVGDFHTRQVSYWNSQMPRAARDHALYGLVSQHGSDELALDAWDGAISYGQLKAFCETLASYLQGKGVGPRSMVPICFEKSCWAVVAMLAVNKLGACFVPIDPSLPSDRIRTIVQKTKPQVAVTSQSQSHILLEIVPTSVVVTAVMLSSLTPADTSYTSCHLPTDPAYCLFTSGTTGTPKGCVVSHAAFSSVSTHCKALQIQPRSRVLQFASYAFGISLIEVFCTLSVGATVCIPSDQDRLNNLAQFMTHNRVNLAMLTPTVLNSIHPHQVPRLETLIVAGELMTTSHVRNWAEDVRLFQALGLTEWAGILCVSRQIRVVADRSNIGKPTNGVVWLADVQDINRLAPIGAPGEMVIEGPSMADGYHDDNERTGARFMTAPPWLAAFSPEIANRRLYRTGDIGHYNPDGSITYIGRKDTQVKVRGQRVELGEVENHITRCLPEGYRAVADIIEPVNVGPGRHYLAAFIVLPPSMQEDKDDSLCNVWATRASNPLSSHIDQVKDSIRSALPGHNLPDFFIPLRHLPVTITGKIDRRRLREIASGFTTKELDELTAQDGQKAISRPQGRKEAIIHRLIVDLLHLVPDQVGMEASFGRLGGIP